MGWDKFEKLVELVKRRITQIVLYNMKDPRIGFMTITKIDLSRDLKECKVFYTVLGTDAERSKTSCALRDARGFIQREVGKTLRTRIIPGIRFIEDPTLQNLERVKEIFQAIDEEKSENNPACDGDPEDARNGDSDEDIPFSKG